MSASIARQPKKRVPARRKSSRPNRQAPRVTRDVIVVGASAGGIEALSKLVAQLPAGLPAAVCVTVHVPPGTPSLLPQILSRAGPLPAAPARDGRPLERGKIIVAPANRHLVLESGSVYLNGGPRENGHRPSIDTLFRSAALSYGPRVIGVVLSGNLDDGAAGLQVIKKHQGTAVVQSPSDAMFPGMPLNALAATKVDHSVAINEMGTFLADLVKTPVVASQAREIFAAGTTDITPSDSASGAPLICPDCGGPLTEVADHGLPRFRCRVGHTYSTESLESDQWDTIERALWAAIRVLLDRGDLQRRMSRKAAAQRRSISAGHFSRRARDAESAAAVLRRLWDELSIDRN